jgi:hypothetical protein
MRPTPLYQVIAPKEAGDLGYMGIHKAIITMLASAPTTEEWLITLRKLLDRLDPGDVGSPDDPITSMLERWTQVPVPEDGTFEGGYFTTLGEGRISVPCSSYVRPITTMGKTTSSRRASWAAPIHST